MIEAMEVGANYQKILSLGEMSYMKDGTLVTGQHASAVMVESEDDLTDLAGVVNPGSIAFTAGMTGIWQLKADGTWQDCMEAGE